MELKKSGIVNKEEVGGIGRLPSGKAHPVRKWLRSMDVGQFVCVYKDEWAWVDKTPQGMVKQVAREMNRRFDFSVSTDDKCWIIERLED